MSIQTARSRILLAALTAVVLAVLFALASTGPADAARSCRPRKPCPAPSPTTPSPPPTTPEPTATSPAPDPATSSPPAAGGWVTVLAETYDTGTAPDPNVWGVYDGPYGSDPHNCADPSQVFIAGGYLQFRLSYRPDLPLCGGGGGAPATRWYSGGMQLRAAYAAVDQRVTLTYRNVLTDPDARGAGVRDHKNFPMHFGDPQSPCWPAGGEIDYMEGSLPDDLQTFIHYGTDCAGSQVMGPVYPVDFTAWHTVRAQRHDHAVTVWVDDMVTPAWSYAGDAATFPDVLQRLVLQQECRAAGCPAGTAPATGYTATVQVDSLTVDNWQP